MNVCSATAMPAVRMPAKVASDPNSVTNVATTISAMSRPTTNRRTTRNWRRRRMSDT